MFANYLNKKFTGESTEVCGYRVGMNRSVTEMGWRRGKNCNTGWDCENGDYLLNAGCGLGKTSVFV